MSGDRKSQLTVFIRLLANHCGQGNHEFVSI